MELTLERFRDNFRGYPLPKILEDLCAFDFPNREWYSGRFELAYIDDTPIYDFQDEHLSEFFGFGHDGNYSLYALWRYQEEIDLEDAPVVYLNSEGEGSGVIACNLSEFLTLLAYDDSPIFGKFQAYNEDFEHTPRNQEFREWIAQRYQLQPADDPNEVVRHASQQFPALPLLEYDD